jgi:hypothetical protein
MIRKAIYEIEYGLRSYYVYKTNCDVACAPYFPLNNDIKNNNLENIWLPLIE